MVDDEREERAMRTSADRSAQDPTARGWDVVVVGAGLAGLTAAAFAARGGAKVAVLDVRDPGGRASMTDVRGVLLGGGPRAFFPGGPGARRLDSLGIRPEGTFPRAWRPALLRDGTLHSAVPAESAVPTIVRLVRGARDGERLGRTSAAEWIGRAPARHRDLLAAVVRLVTYADDLDALSADAAVAQLRTSKRGVVYLHGGFGQLVAALTTAAVASGATVLDHLPVDSVRDLPDGDGHVVVAGEEELVTRAVVLAPGGPAAVRSILGDGAVGDPGPAATAACLELVLARRPRHRFVLGVDEPLYLSVHSPPARLGPKGTTVVHLLRYGATGAAPDRARLEELARIAGVSDDDVVDRRFLSRMVVTPAVPTPASGGLVGRAPVADPGRPGVFLAGDWVGPVGMLADASIDSGAQAGALAAAHALTDARDPLGAVAVAGSRR